jgi:hypothetical protein
VLAARVLLTMNATAAPMFRLIEKHRPTLLIDEADTFMDGRNELRGIVNAGHERNGTVLRCEGDQHEPRVFSVWAPVAIARIGDAHGTIADRSIIVIMQRRPRDQPASRSRRRELVQFEPLRRKCARWVNEHIESLKGAEPELPESLNDRAADGWEPLFAIADEIGGSWPDRSRQAAEVLSADPSSSAAEGAELLLADVRAIFRELDCSRIFMRELVRKLIALDDRPWSTFCDGRPLNAAGLGKLLRPFGISSKPMRIGDPVARGYEVAQFQGAFECYLEPTPVT